MVSEIRLRASKTRFLPYDWDIDRIELKIMLISITFEDLFSETVWGISVFLVQNTSSESYGRVFLGANEVNWWQFSISSKGTGFYK